MDSQKFLFLSSSCALNELSLAASSLLNDIKNVCGTMQYFANEIGIALSKFDMPENKKIIDANIKQIEKLTCEYNLLCQQRKIILNRLQVVRSSSNVAA